MLTWFVLVATFHLQVFTLSPDLTPQHLSHLQVPHTGTLEVIDGLIDGIGQVYFQSTTLAGVLILIGVFYAGWRLGLYAIVGTVVAWLTAYGLGGAFTLLNLGLYGYNGVLTMVAVSAIFHVERRWAPLTGVVATILTVPITAGMSAWLDPYGLPALTMPFVLVTWVFVSARKILVKL